MRATAGILDTKVKAPAQSKYTSGTEETVNMISAGIKVLIIDDDEDDYFITSQYLIQNPSIKVSCTWCYDTREAEAKLKSNEFDLYFLDYKLGARTGLELLKDSIEHGTYKPIILLTGRGTPEIDLAAVQYGAYDYLIKSELSAEKLERCVRYAIERYKSFKLIRDNERKFRLIFENALSFIFTCNESLEFGDCNSAASYFLGYSPLELKGRVVTDFIDEEDKSLFMSYVNAKRNIRNLNLRFITSTGDIKTGNLSFTYFEDSGIEAHWQGIIFDETMRLQAEHAKLQTEKLEANYRLVRTLAHEIRNPLTNVGLAVDALLTGNPNEEQKQYTGIIKRSSGRINEIISDLLQSSRRIELRTEPTDLKVVLEEVIESARDRIGLKNVRTSVALPDQPLIKKLDKEKFKIAILNLVVNAIEAMDKEDNILAIGLAVNAGNATIQIRDNGCGMREDEIAKLFEPFYTTKKHGMGLGLVSALNIIKSHKALIEVESKPQTGTIFRVIFPD